MESLFRVNGKPFFSIGGQVSNSSAYDVESLQRALRGVEALGMNTAAVPVYWETLEPEEGRFCFEQVDMIVKLARERSLKVILLWFGTWKNGASHYVPGWMKAAIERYPMSLDGSGQRTAALSPHGALTQEKDIEAFRRLLEHLKETDREGTVLAVQVENEPGLLGTPRDFSPEGRKRFAEAVPDAVISWLEQCKTGRVYDCYCKNGRQKGKSWAETFGFDAAEIFTAYYVAQYTDAVAAAGKKIYSIPMYVNVWVREIGTRLAGIDFPSGGATSLTLDIWKRFAPHIDCICPDMYFDDFRTYDTLCSIYHRNDNVLYIPESRADSCNGRHLLSALEKHRLSGIHCFAADCVFDREGKLTEEAAAFGSSLRILREMKPLLEKYLGTESLHAMVQYDGMSGDFIDFGDYLGKVDFLDSISDEPYLHLDFRHDEEAERTKKGKGLIIYEGGGSFYLAGEGFKLILHRKTTPEQMARLLVGHKTLATRNLMYRAVEEGVLADDGHFTACRRRNGDETDTGLWVAADIGVLHVQVAEEQFADTV